MEDLHHASIITSRMMNKDLALTEKTVTKCFVFADGLVEIISHPILSLA